MTLNYKTIILGMMLGILVSADRQTGLETVKAGEIIKDLPLGEW